jgi:hypothetical protein
MSLLRRCYAILAWAGATWASAGEAPLPPITGNLSGEIKPLLIPGAPALQWTLALRPGATAEERLADFSLEAKGFRSRGEIRLTTPGDGAWRLTEGQVDLALWAPLVVEKYFPELVGVLLEGTVAVTGEGQLRNGTPTGRVTFDLRDGAWRDPLNGRTIAGIGATGTFVQQQELVSDGPIRLSFREATMLEATARNGAMEFSLEPGGTVRVAKATAAMFDGSVAVTPFAFPLQKPAFVGEVLFTGIEIALLRELLPPVLSDATGKVSGRMAVSYSVQEGLVPGSGRLQIDPGSAATLRLSPQPGFFTSRVPPRLSLLPAKWGAISKLFSPINPAYETLRAIEMGETTLEVNALDVGLRPEGDPAGRTARVVLTARPKAKDAAVESVRFEINVRGPLADVIRMGLEGKVQVRTH